MIEPNANSPKHPEKLPETNCEAVPPNASGGKSMSVFGALFGAAAAVPT
jgi:hypothetical protein